MQDVRGDAVLVWSWGQAGQEHQCADPHEAGHNDGGEERALGPGNFQMEKGRMVNRWEDSGLDLGAMNGGGAR